MLRRMWQSAKTEELTQQALEQMEANLWNGDKPEVYLQFDLLEQFPQLMEPRGLRSESMKWNNTPGLLKRLTTLPTLTVKPTIWDKWCDKPQTYWEPTQEAGDFRPGVALIVCYSLYQDMPRDNLWDKKAISLSIIYVPEHWTLPSFEEAAYVINIARDGAEPVGIMSLARIQKKAPFFPDISYWEYKQHLMIVPLLPPSDNRPVLCGYTLNFAVGALHHRPDNFCKSGEILSWAPPAFRKAPPGQLVLVTGSASKTWGNTRSVPEHHDVPMAPLDTFVQLETDDSGQPILPEYVFALCTPKSWPFPSMMDITILPAGQPTGDDLEEENSSTKSN